MSKIVGNCGKHPGHSMINCPMCAIEEQNKLSRQKYHAVEYAGHWIIQTTPFYDDRVNILDADDVGEKEAEANAKLIEKLLNEHQSPSTMNETKHKTAEEIKSFNDWLMSERLFFVDEVRNWLKSYDREEISFSRFVELFNEKIFDKYHAQFTEEKDKQLARSSLEYLTLSGQCDELQEKLAEKDKEIVELKAWKKKAIEDVAYIMDIGEKDHIALEEANQEIQRLKELLVKWWKTANKFNDSAAREILGAKEFIDYQRSIETMVNKFKIENNL